MPTRVSTTFVIFFLNSLTALSSSAALKPSEVPIRCQQVFEICFVQRSRGVVCLVAEMQTMLTPSACQSLFETFSFIGQTKKKPRFRALPPAGLPTASNPLKKFENPKTFSELTSSSPRKSGGIPIGIFALRINLHLKGCKSQLPFQA
jgi:hypothetical protein